MTFDFTVRDVIPATPKQIYDAWLDSRLTRQNDGWPARNNNGGGRGKICGVVGLHYREKHRAGTRQAHCSVVAYHAVSRFRF